MNLVLPQRPKIKTWNGSTPLTYVQGKLDGIMLTAIKDTDTQETRAYTRHRDPARGDVTNEVSRSEWFKRLEAALCPGESVFGELYSPDRRASQVKSDWSRCAFAVFAIPAFRAEAPLEQLDEWCMNHEVAFVLFDTVEHSSWDLDDPRGLNPDWEGFVLKNGNLVDWHKHKAERTIDLVVSGIKSGWGTFLGMAGALVMRTTEGHEVCSCSGMDLSTRRDIGAKDLGRVAEVLYQYVGDKGRLRHPRFVRWRDDKSPDECSVSQDAELAEYHGDCDDG